MVAVAGGSGLGLGVVRRIEDLERLVSEQLGLALDGALVGKVGDGHEVFGVDSDTATIWLCFIKWLRDIT